MTIWQLFKASFQLLDKNNKFKFFVSFLMQSSLALLDLLGILMLGLVSLSSASKLGISSTPQAIISINEKLNLQDFSELKYAIFTTGLACIFFISKSLIAMYFSKKVFDKLAEKQFLISNQILRRILDSPYQWVRQKNQHEISQTLNLGVPAATVNSLGQLLLLLSEAVLIASILSLFMFISFQGAILLILYMILLISLMSKLFATQITSYNRKKIKLHVSGQILLFDILKLFREIRVQGNSSYYAKVMGNSFQQMSKNYSGEMWVQQIPKYFLEVALILGGFGLLLVISISNDSNQAVLLFAIYITGAARIFPSLIRMQSAVFSIKSQLPLAENLFKMLGEFAAFPPTSKRALSTAGAHKIPQAGSILWSLDQVNLGFSNQSHPLTLQSINLLLHSGERVAIVGPSGAGKSTLLDLLLGLLEPTEGKITLDGCLPSEWIQDHPGRVALVSQESLLIEGTLLENLCPGVPIKDIDDIRLLKIVRELKLEDLAPQEFGGEWRSIGFSGAKLSGGQKQRISIARAIYQEPTILILDESTSALDIGMEKSIMSYIHSSLPDTTIVFVTHKMSTIGLYSRIIYIDNGKILADGDFTTVLAEVEQFRINTHSL